MAHQQARLQRAITALTKAHEGSVAEAEFPLALALGDGGHPRQAAARLRRIAGRPGNDPLFTLAARHQAAFFTGESGAAQQAVRLFGHIVTSARTLLDGPHPDVLDARHQLAYFTGESGNTHAAAHQFRALLNDRERHHPDDHQQIIATRRSCIWFATRPGTLAESEHAMHALLDEATALIGADAPHTPAIRSSLATFAARAGRHDEALERFAALIGDRIRLLEPEHPHVLRSRLDWVHALAGAGHTAQARTEVLSTLHTAETVLETEHRHLRYARTLLEQLSWGRLPRGPGQDRPARAGIRRTTVGRPGAACRVPRACAARRRVVRRGGVGHVGCRAVRARRPAGCAGRGMFPVRPGRGRCVRPWGARLRRTQGAGVWGRGVGSSSAMEDPTVATATQIHERSSAARGKCSCFPLA